MDLNASFIPSLRCRSSVARPKNTSPSRRIDQATVSKFSGSSTTVRRRAAAINFKNHVRLRWVPPAASDPAILDAEKDQIKTLIVRLMIASSSRIQIQLSEALAVIGNHDFPKSWPALLPDLKGVTLILGSDLDTRNLLNDSWFTDIGGEVVNPILLTVEKLLGLVLLVSQPFWVKFVLAALIRRSCERDPSLISPFETSLFPVLLNILVNDVSDFWPYTLQIFAQLVELNKPPLSVNYMHLFVVLLSWESWNRSGDVPALVRLLQAYLQKAPHELNQEGRLTKVLEIFQNLVSASSTDELGFYVLNTVIENLNYEVIAPYVSGIWTTLFMRLQKQPTKLKSFLIFMSLFLIKYGHGPLVDSINAVQPNIFGAILQKFWIPNLKLITGFVELKLTSVASTRLIGDSPILLDNSSAVMWGKMLDSIITLLSRPEQDRVEEEPKVPDIGETLGYTAKFVHLYNAGKKEEDPLKEVRDPKEFLLNTLAKVSATAPGKYPAIIKEIVDPANQSALLQLCSAYNCSIV